MTRPLFGIDEPPAETGERMAYIARGACGHIVIAQADSRRESLGEFISHLTLGLTVERVASQAVRDEGFCSCVKSVQIGAGL